MTLMIIIMMMVFEIHTDDHLRYAVNDDEDGSGGWTNG